MSIPNTFPNAITLLEMAAEARREHKRTSEAFEKAKRETNEAYESYKEFEKLVVRVIKYNGGGAVSHDGTMWIVSFTFRSDLSPIDVCSPETLRLPEDMKDQPSEGQP